MVALLGGYLIRFDFALGGVYTGQLLSLLPIFVLVRVSALYYAGSYQFIWRYAGINDLVAVLKAVGLGLLLLAVINYFRNYPVGMLLAVALFLSALFHRGVLRSPTRGRHRRILVAGAVLASIGLLGIGLYVFTNHGSAPARLSKALLWGMLEELEFREDRAMPRGVLVMETILSFMLLGGLRIAPRLFSELLVRSKRPGRRALVFGAGDVGEGLVRAIRKQPDRVYSLVGFIDDDVAKQRARIHGTPVLGTRADLGRLIDQNKVQELLVTPTALSRDDLRELAAVCWQRRVSVRRVSGLSGMVKEDIGLENLESVDIADLMGRPEVELDPQRVSAFLRKKVVLVTGAGGSIGSELCRQVAECRPDRIILFGKGENSIYVIQNELRMGHPALNIESVIGDICNQGKVDHVLATYQPDVVFHAAAYKHVPFMEDNPEESVWNNVFGTRTVAAAAEKHGVGRFVMISTDKAVNPTSMMGVTKRVAELVLEQMAGNGGVTAFVTVRFGNVLRSSGSVMPLFEKQIEAGGPITVTHPDMIRYFMSIPEAVRLVLHSATLGTNGDLCILDMGKQMRIVELAENMIRVAGKVPYEDIDIVFTGVRPGEKLSEELFTEEEARSLQRMGRIFVCHAESCAARGLDGVLEQLREAALHCRRHEIVELLQRAVPSYVPAGCLEKSMPTTDA
ncbi:polysaccharide biosynthesis protein [Candidatus Latescibacterota bacterium]